MTIIQDTLQTEAFQENPSYSKNEIAEILHKMEKLLKEIFCEYVLAYP